MDSESDVEKALEKVTENPDKYLGLSFLVCGKTGIGKSSLVNSLVGEEVCPVGDPGRESDDDDSEGFEAKTVKLKETKVEINDVPIHIWDSPGLQDGTDNEGAYLQMMYDECKDADLVLYCMDMTTTRWTPPEVKATDLLTQKFGVEFWEKSVLVLTKANTLSPAPKEGETEFDYCKRLYRKFVDKFRKQLTKQGVSEEVAKRIPAVAVGRIGNKDEERLLWYVCDRAKETKKRQDFLPEFWVTCFESTSGEGRDKLLDMTGTDRLQPIDEQSEKAQKYRKQLQERKRMDEEIRELVQKHGSLKSWKDIVYGIASFLTLGYWKKSAESQPPPAASKSDESHPTPAAPSGTFKPSNNAPHTTPPQPTSPQQSTPTQESAENKTQPSTSEAPSKPSLPLNDDQLDRVADKLDEDSKTTKEFVLRRFAKYIKSTAKSATKFLTKPFRKKQ